MLPKRQKLKKSDKVSIRNSLELLGKALARYQMLKQKRRERITKAESRG